MQVDDSCHYGLHRVLVVYTFDYSKDYFVFDLVGIGLQLVAGHTVAVVVAVVAAAVVAVVVVAAAVAVVVILVAAVVVAAAGHTVVRLVP